MKPSKLTFKQDFWVGAATSGPQTEGFNNHLDRASSVWDYWYHTEPQKFFMQQNVQGNVYQDLERYINKIQELGLNSFRTSIQWTRLMPDGINVDLQAVNYYRMYFSKLRAAKVKVMVNLYHFDLPLWLYEQGGFLHGSAIKHYVNYAQQAFRLFGDLVDIWFTFNEPLVPVEMGYLNYYHLPSKVNVKAAMQVMHNLVIAHLRAVKAFRKLKLKSQIGIVVNITPIMERTDSIDDLWAKDFANSFFNRSFLDPIFKGVYPLSLVNHAKRHGYMWKISQAEKKLLKSDNKIDLVGLNYYQPRRVQAVQGSLKFDLHKPFEGQVFAPYKYENAVMNTHRNWEIYPRGIYDMLMDFKTNYPNVACFIAENGIGISQEEQFRNEEGLIDDQYRIAFIKNHLQWVHKAINKGCLCRGYHLWTLIDNWSWLNAYKNRYGLVELNLDTQKLVNKTSFAWYQKFALEKEFHV